MLSNATSFISYKAIPFLTGENKAPEVYITNVFYLNWQQLKASIIKSLPYIKGICLDIGSGNSPYKKYIVGPADKYIAVDNENTNKYMFKNANEKFINADIKKLPFDDGFADTILLTQVLEHIDEPFIAIAEISRVLKKDGILILSVPFMFQAHGMPYDYFRFSEYASRKILSDNNFETLEFHYQGYFGTAIISMINGFIWTIASKSKTLRNFVLLPVLLLLFAFNNIAGLMLDVIKSKEFCPNFWIIAKKL